MDGITSLVQNTVIKCTQFMFTSTCITFLFVYALLIDKHKETYVALLTTIIWRLSQNPLGMIPPG